MKRKNFKKPESNLTLDYENAYRRNKSEASQSNAQRWTCSFISANW